MKTATFTERQWELIAEALSEYEEYLREDDDDFNNAIADEISEIEVPHGELP